MRILAIDTATSTASVAIEIDGETRAEETRAARDHAASLPDMVAAVLATVGIAPTDIGMIAVSGGPGSFTGLRVGFSFAKGFAFATGAGLIGVPTLEALAESARVDGRIVTLLDARRGELYRAEFEVSDGAMTCRRAPEALPVDEFLANPGPPATFVGEGVAAYHGRLEAVVAAGSQLLPDVAPRAAVVACLGRRLFELHGPAEMANFEPTYVADPNIKLPRVVTLPSAASTPSMQST